MTISIPPYVHVQYGELYVCLYHHIAKNKLQILSGFMRSFR